MTLTLEEAVSELVKISALRKRLEHNINEQGKEDINPIEIIAQSTDTEIQAISEKIKQSNLTKTLRSFERFSDESLNEYLYEKLPIHNNFRIDYQSLARKANSFSAFEEMVQKRIWFKLRKEIKINLIKHKKGFTYSQLEKEMPEEVRRGLFQIYRHTH